VRWLASRIPAVSATELGVYRLLFGLALIWTIYDMRLPTQAFPHEFHLRSHVPESWTWIHDLAAQPERVVGLEYIAITLAALFAIGLATRLSYTALVLVLTVWTFVRLTHTAVHNWSAMFVTLWAFLPVRWGDGFSVDRLIGSLFGRPPLDNLRRRSYGYALWVPGLVFGTAMAGAGSAKVVQGGLAWITNGTVKYHFVTDAAKAPSDWGLVVATQPTAAVLLSGAAVATELTVVLAVLVPSYLWRLPFALSGLGLLIGFYIFQNEWWWAWWTLYLAFFIPWPQLVRLVARYEANATNEAWSRLTWLHVSAVLAICVLQITASTLRIERAPFMSDYPMYSTTYTSIAEFQEQNPGQSTYHFSVRFADGTQQSASQVFEDLGLDEVVRDAFADIRDGNQDAVEDTAPVIASAAKQLAEHYGEPISGITVLLDERGFNWETGKYYWRQIRTPVYTFELE